MNRIFEPTHKRLPSYLTDHYQWAYTTEKAVRFWDRPWLINLILWGNYRRLTTAALARLGDNICGNCLQIACVYGDLTPRLLARLAPEASLQVVDIAPVQLANTARKCGHRKLRLLQQDSSQLPFADHSFDSALLFFLLHEQPQAVRSKTLQEALRVIRPGGKLVIVDYRRPGCWHPLRWVMSGIFHWLEPFASGFWQQPLDKQLPKNITSIEKTTLFGGLYQIVTITR